MRRVIFLCILLVLWSKALGVDTREGLRLLRSGFDKNLIKNENFELLQNGLGKEFLRSSAMSNLNASSQCIEQLSAIVTETHKGTLWALKFLDSWGKLPAGLLWGHLVELGNFDECLSIENNYVYGEHTDLISGQYCLANFPIGAFFKNVSEDLSQIANVKVGICIPRSCNAFYANHILNQTLTRILKVTIKSDIVTQEKCIKTRTSEFETIDWIAVLINCVRDYLRFGHKNTRNILGISNQLLLAFALSVNMKLLFRTTSKKSPNIISCLNGIRCMSIVWIIFGHSYMMSAFLPNINTVEILEWYRTPFSMFLQSGTISVDSFFFLSGLLLVWAALKEMEKNGGKLNVVLMYLHRYIRLTPVVAVAILFFVSLYRHMGNGPLWKGFTSTHELCHETWWATLLYIQNYAAAGKMCLGHTWYLAVDTQLYIISPLILIPLFKWKKRAVGAVIVLGLLLVALLFTVIVLNNFSVFSTTGNLGADTQEMRKIYYATEARASPWLVGIIFGYFLYNHRNSRITMSKKVVVGGWLMSLALLATVIFCVYPKTFPEARPLTAVEGGFYLSLIRVAWPISLSWIVFACVNGYGGFANTFLSWTFWQPMARLSYCMYINHLIVETIHSGRTKVNVHFSNYDTILSFWGHFGITLLASIATYLMFESPMIGIEKVLFESKKNKSISNATVSKQNLCDD